MFRRGYDALQLGDLLTKLKFSGFITHSLYRTGRACCERGDVCACELQGRFVSVSPQAVRSGFSPGDRLHMQLANDWRGSRCASADRARIQDRADLRLHDALGIGQSDSMWREVSKLVSVLKPASDPAILRGLGTPQHFAPEICRAVKAEGGIPWLHCCPVSCEGSHSGVVTATRSHRDSPQPYQCRSRVAPAISCTRCGAFTASFSAPAKACGISRPCCLPRRTLHTVALRNAFLNDFLR